MALIPKTLTDPTLEAMNRQIEVASKADRPRPYLGMSGIGHECERKSWYEFRWCAPAGGGFDANTLRKFADGHRGEDLMAERMRAVPGVELWTHDQHGKQFGFVGVAGHFRGHCDGVIRGLKQAPVVVHCWENKISAKGPMDLDKAKHAVGEKNALKKWHPTYYVQAQLYMHYGEFSRHYLTVQSPGGWLPESSVRTDYNEADALAAIEKATRVIASATPLPRLTNDPAFWTCKFCSVADVCHGTSLPKPSCRTCVHATAELDGDARWSCAKYGVDLSVETQQRTDCPSHLYIPSLLERLGEQTDASGEENWIAYQTKDGRTFRNGTGGFASAELHANPNLNFLLNPDVQLLRKDGGVIVAEDAA